MADYRKILELFLEGRSYREPSRFSCRRFVGGVTGRCAVSLSVVVPLVLLGWDVPEVAVESFVIIPSHPLEGDLLNIRDRLERANTEGRILCDGFVL